MTSTGARRPVKILGMRPLPKKHFPSVDWPTPRLTSIFEKWRFDRLVDHIKSSVSGRTLPWQTVRHPLAYRNWLDNQIGDRHHLANNALIRQRS